MNVFEIKSTGDIKDIDSKQGIISGYFASFNNLDADGDIIRPGAFSKSIAENGPQSAKPRIKYLLNHRTDQPVGKLTELTEDSHGLRYTAKIGTHAIGKEYLQMVEDGIITEHSIGYKTISETKGKDARYLNEIKLFEGSGLTFLGSNSNTPVISLKSYPEQSMEHLDNLMNFSRSGKLEDEEVVELIEIELKQLRQFFIDQSTKAAENAPAPENEDLLREVRNINNFLKLKKC